MGLEQGAKLVALFKTADFSKLETFTNIQKELVSLQFDKDYNDVFNQFQNNLTSRNTATEKELDDLISAAGAYIGSQPAVSNQNVIRQETNQDIHLTLVLDGDFKYADKVTRVLQSSQGRQAVAKAIEKESSGTFTISDKALEGNGRKFTY